MYCFKCKKKLDTPKKVGFRDSCLYCGADLHVCKNCRHYAPGKPNDCNVPNTEFVKDRERFNFCEDFSPLDTPSMEKTHRKDEIAKKLFKD
ncbi:MAG: hypothetical protein HZB76_03850 [Chlamydiae bacterium]|nr:hypothetical protein [Chlamydiota bacterium]